MRPEIELYTYKAKERAACIRPEIEPCVHKARDRAMHA